MTKLQEYAAQLKEAVEKMRRGELVFEHFDSPIGDTGEYSHCDRIKDGRGYILAEAWDVVEDDICDTIKGFVILQNLVPPLLEEIGKQGEWIPVTPETMPPFRRSVLAWCPENKNRYTAFIDNQDGDMRWYHFAAGHKEITEPVTHWMSMDSLPKPPEITSSSPSSASAPSGEIDFNERVVRRILSHVHFNDNETEIAHHSNASWLDARAREVTRLLRSECCTGTGQEIDYSKEAGDATAACCGRYTQPMEIWLRSFVERNGLKRV